MRILDLQTSKARYELKVVLLNFWRVNVKTIRGFINNPLADLSRINLRHNNITTNTNTILYCRYRKRQYITEIKLAPLWGSLFILGFINFTISDIYYDELKRVTAIIFPYF